MKNLILITALFLLTNMLIAQQSGVIKYNQVTKLDFKAPAGMDLGDMMPSEISTSKDLFFEKYTTVYKDAKDEVREDVEMESDDGSFQIVIGSPEGEDILYTDTKEKKSLHQTNFMSKDFLIKEDLTKYKWKITGDRIKYLGYVCQKATMMETVDPGPMAEKGELPKERGVVAWFTTEIPYTIGPGSYNQLPGAILMISVDEGKTEIKATEVILGPADAEQLVRPTKGQLVTHKEYEEIMAKKMKEMQEHYGGRSGEGMIMIRG